MYEISWISFMNFIFEFFAKFKYLADKKIISRFPVGWNQMNFFSYWGVIYGIFSEVCN